MTRGELIVALTDAFAARPEVVEVKHEGSLGRGVGDDHSDVDLQVIAADDQADALKAVVADIIRDACDPVLIRTFPFVTTIVTREWLRADVAVVPVALAGVDFGRPAAVAAQQTVEELFRCFGLAPIVTARGEWESSVVGTGMMVGLLTELMQLENGTARVGGALRLGDRLTPEQRAVITSLPPSHADPGSAAATHRALLADFLPRARRLADQFEFEYPDEVEAALLAHLARHGLEPHG
jgi:hypothetical protein